MNQLFTEMSRFSQEKFLQEHPRFFARSLNVPKWSGLPNNLFTFVLPYGIQHHMHARLIYHEKFVYADGAIREMVLWQLPRKTPDRPHGFKYRLYYGLADGTCLIRYDNESGKGDHKHIKGKELPFCFKDVETLVADFLEEIEKQRR